MPRIRTLRENRPRTATRVAAALDRAAGAAVEWLESRRLLSANLDSAGTLLVTGTEGDNEITVERVDAFMRVNEDGRATNFNAASVRRVEVRALGGSDEVSIERAGVPGTLLGGAGDDSLTGGSQNDVLRGEADNDTLIGLGGGDDMSGGTGTLDRVSYFNATGPVTVGLGTFADDGQAGERDNARNDIEEVGGGPFNDTIRGTDANNTLIGAGGNDRLHGGGGNDRLVGSEGDDVLLGESGNDSLRGDAGADDMSGGAGVDTVDYGTSEVGVTVGLGTVADDGAPGERDNARSDNENVVGSDANDRIFGTGAVNALDGSHGDDELFGRGGDDTLTGGPGRDALHGDDGNDLLRSRDGEADFLAGGFGTDTADADSIDTFNGVERGVLPMPGPTLGADGTLRVNATTAADNVFVGPESGNRMRVTVNDQQTDFDAARVRRIEIHGFGGNDILGIGNTTVPGAIFAGPGNDVLNGGNGNDTLRGEDGDDVLNGRGGGDDMSGGAGVDIADYSLRTRDLTIGLGNFADDGEAGERDNVRLDIEDVLTGRGNDTVRGSSANNSFSDLGGGNDTYYGFGGNDNFTPRDGNDRVFGGDGNDSVVSATEGDGADYYEGGPGFDGLDYSARTGDLRIGLGTVADDGVIGEGDNARDDFESVSAGNGNDRVSGTNAINFIFGGPGDDELFGRGGNDTIAGGTGRDALHGDDGNDLLQARDGESDFLAGGFGTDTAEADAVDTLNGVERRA
jgi:Ca2+-binding RTX toxin-like protein